MTDNDRGRPRHRTGPNVDSPADASATLPAAGDISVQLERRRFASRRLPPLDDGQRDPWMAPRSALSVESARAAYFHLEACGLLSELVVDALARQIARRREVA